MSSIYVDGHTAGLIERASAILEAKEAGETPQSRTRRVPLWLPDGEEVKTVAQASVMMGVPAEVAAHYVLEQKDAGEDLAVDALALIQRKAFFGQQQMEEKVVRHVRTPAGAKKYGQPIGSIIIRDGVKLRNLKISTTDYEGASAVEDSAGRQYLVSKDPDTGEWAASVANNGEWDWDNLAVDNAKSEEDVLQMLDEAVTKNKHRRNAKPLTPDSAETLAKPKGVGRSTKEPAAKTPAKKPAAKPAPKATEKPAEKKPDIKAPAGKKKWSSADAIELAKRQKMTTKQRREFESLDGEQQHDYIEQLKDSERAQIPLSHDDLMEHALTAADSRAKLKKHKQESSRPSWFPKEPNAAVKELVDYYDSIEDENPGLWDGPQLKKRIESLQKMDKINAEEFSKLTAKQKAAYSESYAKDGDHDQAINAGILSSMTEAQKDAVKGQDSIVRSRYFDKRRAGMSHVEAMKAAKEGGRQAAAKPATSKTPGKDPIYMWDETDLKKLTPADMKKFKNHDLASLMSNYKLKGSDKDRVGKAASDEIISRFKDGKMAEGPHATTELKNVAAAYSRSSTKPTVADLNYIEERYLEEMSKLFDRDKAHWTPSMTRNINDGLKEMYDVLDMTSEKQGLPKRTRRKFATRGTGSRNRSTQRMLDDLFGPGTSAALGGGSPKGSEAVAASPRPKKTGVSKASITDNIRAEMEMLKSMDKYDREELAQLSKDQAAHYWERRKAGDTHPTARRKARGLERQRQNEKDFPLDSQVSLTIHGINNRQEEATGKVVGHNGGYIDVQTEKHGTVSVPREKLTAGGKPEGGTDNMKARSMAFTAVRLGDPVDAFRFTMEHRQRLQREYDMFLDNASPEELITLRARLKQLSESGSLDTRQRATAKQAWEQLTRRMKNQ